MFLLSIQYAFLANKTSLGGSA